MYTMQETLGVAYLVNAPKGFSTVYSAAKIFIDQSTQQKIRIFGHLDQNPGEKKMLLDELGPENLPHWLGGSAAHELEDCPPWQFSSRLQSHLERARNK